MGRSKAELLYQGETFLNRLVRVLTAHCDPVIVVTAKPAAVRGAINVVNPDPSRGMLRSVQCGMRAVPESAHAVAFMPVDLPAVREETVAALIEAWSGEVLRIPRFDGRRGHPVVIGRALISEFLALPDGAKPSDVIHRFADRAVYVDVLDNGIVRDVDTPSDYEELCGASFSSGGTLVPHREAEASPELKLAPQQKQ